MPKLLKKNCDINDIEPPELDKRYCDILLIKIFIFITCIKALLIPT